MPHTNTSAALATDITPLLENGLLFSDTIPASELADTLTFWYVATLTTPRQVSAFALGTPVGVVRTLPEAVWTPQASTFSGTPSALVPYPAISSLTSIEGAINFPLLTLPFTVFTSFTVHVVSGTNIIDPMRLQLQPSPALTGQPGSILITNFNEEWPSVVVGTDGQVKQSAYIASCDFGAILDDGTIAVLDNGTNPPPVKIYSPTGTFLSSTAGLTTALTFQQIQGDGVDTFYVGASTTAVAAVVKTISKTGVVGGTTWTLPANSKGLQGMAPNRAETILYYQSTNGGAGGSAVFKWDLIGSAALPDLAATIATFNGKKDLFVMKDGNILVGYQSANAAVTPSMLKRYNPAGTVLNTYLLPLSMNFDRFAVGTDDPASFWVWVFPFATGGSGGSTARFYHYQTSDGALLSTFDVPLFTDGINTGPDVNNPPRFGISNSCPLLIIREAFPAPPGGATGTDQAGFTTDPLITRRLRRAPWLNEEQLLVFHKYIRIDFESGRGLTTGQGSDPQIMLSWSDDGGHTWVPPLNIGVGKVGEYNWQVIRRGLGQTRQRAYEITISDPIAANVVGAYLDLALGRS